MQVSLQVPNAVDGMPDLGFEGQWAPTHEGLDCVAMFDGKCWRLELLAGIGTNIRYHLCLSHKPTQSTELL